MGGKSLASITVKTVPLPSCLVLQAFKHLVKSKIKIEYLLIYNVFEISRVTMGISKIDATLVKWEKSLEIFCSIVV